MLWIRLHACMISYHLAVCGNKLLGKVVAFFWDGRFIVVEHRRCRYVIVKACACPFGMRAFALHLLDMRLGSSRLERRVRITKTRSSSALPACRRCYWLGDVALMFDTRVGECTLFQWQGDLMLSGVNPMSTRVIGWQS